MLIGAAGPAARAPERLGICERGTDRAGGTGALAAVRPWGIAGLDDEERVAHRTQTGSWLVVSGHVHRDLAAPGDDPAQRAASTLLSRLESRGAQALAEIDGSFALAWFDGHERRLHLLRDRFGVEPLFFGLGPGGVVFGSRTNDLVASGLVAPGLCPQGLSEFLTFGFTPSDATLDAQLRKVLPGHRVTIDTNGNVIEIERWTDLPAAGRTDEVGDASADRFRSLLEASVARRLRGGRAAVLQSESIASRAVAALAMRQRDVRLLPFPDVPEDEAQALEIENAVAEMDVPLCDFSAWLAGDATSERPDLVLAGDAGAALAGIDDGVPGPLGASYDTFRLPRSLERALFRLRVILGGSDEARGLRGALARVAPHPDLPYEIGAWRWRCSFSPGEVLALATSSTRRMLAPANPFRSLVDPSRPCDDLDASRLLLLRPFRTEARLPLCDPEVVDCARRMRDAGAAAGDPMRQVREALEGVPGSAAPQRPERLRGSARLEQWLRGDGLLARRVAEVLGPEAIAARGLLRPEAMRRMLGEHRSRRRDYSRRLWTLFVLELWLRAREGAAASGATAHPRSASSPRGGVRRRAAAQG